MTTTDVHTTTTPDHIARQIVLPEGHRDEPRLFAAYEWLRRHNPLGQVAVEGFDPMWLVSKHADILEVERQPLMFSSGGGEQTGTHSPILQSQAGDEFIKSVTGGTLRIMQTVTFLDPPEHTAVKNVAADWFRPPNLKKWEDQIRSIARDAIDKHLHSGVNDIDFIEQFAVHYPLHVIMSLFGVPECDEPRMMALTQDFFGTADPDSQRPEIEELTPDAAAKQWTATVADFYAYFDTFVEERRATPRDDLATIIANARTEDGNFYDKTFAYGWFIAIATAGHDTTTSTLAGTIEQLALHSDHFAAVKDKPELIPTLVQEGLRWASPVKQFMRRALQDYVLRGQHIKAGDRLMLLYQSANRDSDVFEDPDQFKHDRKPNRQIAFGYGPHNCVGQHLAKIELRIMLEELLSRTVSIELTGERKVLQTNFVGGLKNLPVRLTLN